MPAATFRFYSELNDFLPREQRFHDFSYRFDNRPAIKDAIEAIGAPHTEVELILVNGVSQDFSYHLANGDRVSVYPMFESIDISALLRVRPQPLREVRFVLDAHLGRLAVYLRMLGFDALYRSDFADDELARISRLEGRILLTRDRGLLKRGEVTHGCFIRSTDYRFQVLEVVRRFDLSGALHPFSRCLRCNRPLEPVSKEALLDRLPQETRRHYQDFWRCTGCGQVYWEGSHYRRMSAFIQWLLDEQDRPGREC